MLLRELTQKQPNHGQRMKNTSHISLALAMHVRLPTKKYTASAERLSVSKWRPLARTRGAHAVSSLHQNASYGGGWVARAKRGDTGVVAGANVCNVARHGMSTSLWHISVQPPHCAHRNAITYVRRDGRRAPVSAGRVSVAPQHPIREE